MIIVKMEAEKATCGVRPKKKNKKIFVFPLPTDPKNQKIRVSLFFLILNFAFLNKNVKIKCQYM